MEHSRALDALSTPGKRGALTQQLQVLYAALVDADVAAGRGAAYDDAD
jgi:hypothetical protein